MNNDILDLIGKRLIKGEKKYGHENVASDGRDFEKEALEEALDCAVYLAAKIVENRKLINVIKRRNEMGRAIDTDNRLDKLENRIKLVEDALEEMIQTRVHHVDLTDEKNLRTEGIEIKPDEEFTAPVRVKKTTPRIRKTKAATATT